MSNSYIGFGSSFKKGLKTSRRVFSLVLDDLINKTLSSNTPSKRSNPEVDVKINHNQAKLQKEELYNSIVGQAIDDENQEYYRTINKIQEESKVIRTSQGELYIQEEKAAQSIPGEESNLDNIEDNIEPGKTLPARPLQTQNYNSNIEDYSLYFKKALLTGFYAGLSFCIILLILLKR